MLYYHHILEVTAPTMDTILPTTTQAFIIRSDTKVWTDLLSGDAKFPNQFSRMDTIHCHEGQVPSQDRPRKISGNVQMSLSLITYSVLPLFRWNCFMKIILYSIWLSMHQRYSFYCFVVLIQQQQALPGQPL